MRNFFLVNCRRMFFLSVTIMLNRTVTINTTEERTVKNLSYLVLAVAVTMLIGCVEPVRVRRADVDVGGSRVILDQGGQYPAGNGGFCPPGQAKKGRC